jgi:tRNA-specific 2-thiouridylase
MGLAFFTLGQRKGIGIGGSQDGNGDAWYVARKDMATNTLYVAQGHTHPWLCSKHLNGIDASWISGTAPLAGAYAAKTRYRQADAKCALEPASAGFNLQFEASQWAVTPGQSAVVYDGDICLGGGIITASPE